MTEILAFANNSPWLTFFIALLLLDATCKVISRTYRLIMVLTRGWPTAPNMDSDGDIVHPKKDDDDDV